MNISILINESSTVRKKSLKKLFYNNKRGGLGSSFIFSGHFTLMGHRFSFSKKGHPVLGGRRRSSCKIDFKPFDGKMLDWGEKTVRIFIDLISFNIRHATTTNAVYIQYISINLDRIHISRYQVALASS